MGNERRNKRSIYLTMGVLCLAGFGCNTEEKPKEAAAPPPAQSVIRVTTTPNGIELRTPSATFTLSPSGALTGVLQTSTDSLTLENAGAKAGQTISVAKKEYTGVQLGLSHADVQNASGKLGSLGNQVNVKGQIPGLGAVNGHPQIQRLFGEN